MREMVTNGVGREKARIQAMKVVLTAALWEENKERIKKTHHTTTPTSLLHSIHRSIQHR